MTYRSRDASRYRPGKSVSQDRYRRQGKNNGGKWLLALLCVALAVLAVFLAALIRRHWPFPPRHPIPTVVTEEPAHFYDSVDAVAISMQPQANETAGAFAHRLVTSARTDSEKARAIYRWITDNIAYDESILGDPTPEDEAVPTVMARRKTICTGYSQLYKAMANAVGLECEAVRGWGKGLHSSSSTTAPDHAWNAVKIGSNWRLVDATWGAGHTTGSGWKKDFQGVFFFTDPAIFVQSHLPTQPAWEFIDPPWTRARFDALPHMWPRFFEMGMGLGSHFDKTIVVRGGHLKVWLKVPPDVYLSEAFYQGETKLALRSQAEGNIPGKSRYEFEFDFAGQTPDRLVIFASRSLNGSYGSVLEYSLRNSP
jgi:hypothetical protein